MLRRNWQNPTVSCHEKVRSERQENRRRKDRSSYRQQPTEGSPKLLPRPVDSHLHRFGAATEYRTDLCVRAFLVFGKNEWLTQILRQRGHGATHRLGTFLSLHFVSGQGAVLRQGVAITRAGRFDFGVKGDLWMARTPAEAVFNQIACDGVEPRRKLLAGVETRPALIKLHKS